MMDELVRHCLKELAFEGDLGKCNSENEDSIFRPGTYQRRGSSLAVANLIIYLNNENFISLGHCTIKL